MRGRSPHGRTRQARAAATRSHPAVMTLPEDESLRGDQAPDPLPAALLALADHEERLAEVGRQVDDLDGRLQALERGPRRDELADEAGYSPIPAPRWWLLPAVDRAEAVERLAAWVDQVYVGSYGHLAGMLAPCWREHDLCLFILDFASELHSVLYLRPSRSARTLGDQAEFALRILPAAAELMRAETSRCDHTPTRASTSPTPNVLMRGTGSAGANARAGSRSYGSQVSRR